MADLLAVAEILLVLSVFAGRAIQARVRTWSAALVTLLFVCFFAGLLVFSQSPARMEALFGPTRWMEVRLQLVVNLALFLLVVYGWQIPLPRAWRLLPLAGIVALVSSGEAFSVFLFVATGKSYVDQFDRSAATPRGWRDWLLLGLASALFASCGELVLRALLQSLAGPNAVNLLTTLSMLRRDDLWLVPAADMMLFVPLALGLALLQRRWPRWISWPAAVFTFSYLSLAWPPLALLLESTYPLARMLLLFGIAHSLAPAVAQVWLNRPARLATVNWLLASTWGLACLAAIVWPRAGADVGKSLLASPTSKPDVVVITLDTVRAPSLGLYGNPRPTTPELAKWARRGVVFERAMAPSSWTLPTHASLFSGRLPHEHGADFLSPLRRDVPLLAERFAAAGYATAGFVANPASCGAHTGLARGFQQYEEHPPVSKEFWRLSALGKSSFCRGLPFLRKTAAELNAEFFSWLDRHESQPYLAFLNFYDAHEPYDVPDPRFDQFTSTPAHARYVARERWQRIASAVPWDPLLGADDQLQLALDTYEGSIAYLDYHLGQLLDELARRGSLDNTLVVITSDHGEHFGEHGLRSHAVSLYRQLIQVPLMVLFGDRVPAAQRVSETVGLLDLPATILELAGLPAEGIPGDSLATHWRPGPPGKAVRPLIAELSQVSTLPDLPNSEGPIQSLIYGEWHYLRYPGQPREELFDVVNDPLEQRNLTGTPAAPEDLLADLRRRLDAALAPTAQVADPTARLVEERRAGPQLLAESPCPPGFLAGSASWPCLCGRRHDDLLSGHTLSAAVDRLARSLSEKVREHAPAPSP